MSRNVVIGKDASDKEIQVFVVSPSHQDHTVAMLAYNKKISELIRSGAGKEDRLLMRSEIPAYLEKMGLWTQEDSVSFNRTQNSIREKELTLRKGGIKISEARKLALEMSDLRAKLMVLYAKKTQLDTVTMEAVAENYKFNVLVSRCTLTEKGEPFFVDVNDYLSRSTEEIVIKAAVEMAKLIYNYDDKMNEKLFESQFLKSHGLMNDDGQLVNKNGNLVDRDGRKIDKNGRYIDDSGNFIDRQGNRLDENGQLLIEEQPFIDDNE